MYKYTRVARGQDGVEVKSMINLILVRKDMHCSVEYVRVVRGMGRDPKITMLFCVGSGW